MIYAKGNLGSGLGQNCGRLNQINECCLCFEIYQWNDSVLISL